MTTELIQRAPHVPAPRGSDLTAPIASFPTTACASSAVGCPDCVDCADDCADCRPCRDHECNHCSIPDLTPRTAGMLAVAGGMFGALTADGILHSKRPGYRSLITRTFDELTRALQQGERPRPQHLMAQLCLHLMISAAAALSCDLGESLVEHLPFSPYDYDFESLYDTLLRDDQHLVLLAEVRRSSGRTATFDFDTLADLLPSSRLNALFADFEADDPVR